MSGYFYPVLVTDRPSFLSCSPKAITFTHTLYEFPPPQPHLGKIYWCFLIYLAFPEIFKLVRRHTGKCTSLEFVGSGGVLGTSPVQVPTGCGSTVTACNKGVPESKEPLEVQMDAGLGTLAHLCGHIAVKQYAGSSRDRHGDYTEGDTHRNRK